MTDTTPTPEEPAEDSSNGLPPGTTTDPTTVETGSVGQPAKDPAAAVGGGRAEPAPDDDDSEDEEASTG